MVKYFKNLVFIVEVVILFICINSCKKRNIPENIYCENAQVCVGNLTQDTIFYVWNSEGELTDTLLPGKSTCLFVGPVSKIYSSKTGELKEKQYHAVLINSSRGYWAMNVETCLKKSNFEYDIDNPSSGLIFLYAE